MKFDITDEGFRAFLERPSWEDLHWTSGFDIHPDIMIDTIMDYDSEYRNYYHYLNQLDGEPIEEQDDAIALYPLVQSALEELSEEDLLDFYMNWVNPDRVMDELMFLDEDARICLIKGFDPLKYFDLKPFSKN